MRPYWGVSAYAAGAWDDKTTDAYFKCFPRKKGRYATAVLWGPWKTKRLLKFLERFCATFANQPHLVEIHISAETARRTGRNGRQICPALSVAQYDKGLRNADSKVIAAVKKRVNTIMTRVRPILNENTKLILSVGLEDNLSHEAACELIGIIQYECTPCTLVRNPMMQEGAIKLTLNERHGRNIGGTEIHNFDGVHVGAHSDPKMEDISYENALKEIKAHPGFKVMFLWSAYAQGWKNQPAQPYAGRTYVISPEEQAGFRAILKGV